MERTHERIEKIQDVQNGIQAVLEKYLSEALSDVIVPEIMIELLNQKLFGEDE